MALHWAVLIPAYQPDERLGQLAQRLREQNIGVVVVDDGSTGCAAAFAAAEQAGCTVLHHDGNRGKGRALKTGFAWLAQHGFDAAVTADADGQHTAADILRVAAAMEAQPGRLILGARDVAQMPGKSRAGNSLTRALFSLLYGIHLQDTQTGLRGIPLGTRTQALLDMAGERYEYEMNMLVYSGTLFGGITEIPIETIYINRNETSHFRPLRDGAKIYAVLLRHFPKFLITSLLSFVLDYSLFALLYYTVAGSAAAATVGARVVSATFNYLINKHFVFRSTSKSYTALHYLALAVCILLMNSGLMYLLVDRLGLPALVVKIFVEALMYLVSFAVQNNLASRGAAPAKK